MESGKGKGRWDVYWHTRRRGEIRMSRDVHFEDSIPRKEKSRANINVK